MPTIMTTTPMRLMAFMGCRGDPSQPKCDRTMPLTDLADQQRERERTGADLRNQPRDAEDQARSHCTRGEHDGIDGAQAAQRADLPSRGADDDGGEWRR